MKVLSLRQPWADIVVNGPKRIENRRWPTSFRGTFLIHAAKGMTLAEYGEAVRFARKVDPKCPIRDPKDPLLLRGGIIGRARLVDVIPPCLPDFCPHPWHMFGQYGFVLEDVTPLPFEPLRGMLGFFEHTSPEQRSDSAIPKDGGR